MRYFFLPFILAGAGAGHASPTEPETAVDDGPSAIEQRIELERKTHNNRFSITPHRPTYILPVTYNGRPNTAPYEAVPEPEPNPTEFKFQFSFKVLLEKGLFGGTSLAFGYTQVSFWQAYNGDYSSPFRETNHEPEMIMAIPTDYSIAGWHNRFLNLMVNHQSNGRSDPLSRSWNRIILESVMERGNWYISARPWVRLPENREDDDNPDIDRYMGNFEIRALYRSGPKTFGLMLRNNLRTENRGALQLEWTFPLRGRLQGYAQYFTGYGESLIDYDHYSNRFGVGVMLINWL